VALSRCKDERRLSKRQASTAALRSSLTWLAREHFKFTLPRARSREAPRTDTLSARPLPLIRQRGRDPRCGRSGGAASARLSPANAGAIAANFETAPLAQADVFAGQKRDADRLERAPDRPGDSRQGRSPLRLKIVDRTRADRGGRCELCDRPAKQSARRTALGG
jgi:hypothetical protein